MGRDYARRGRRDSTWMTPRHGSQLRPGAQGCRGRNRTDCGNADPLPYQPPTAMAAGGKGPPLLPISEDALVLPWGCPRMDR